MADSSLSTRQEYSILQKSNRLQTALHSMSNATTVPARPRSVDASVYTVRRLDASSLLSAPQLATPASSGGSTGCWVELRSSSSGGGNSGNSGNSGISGSSGSNYRSSKHQ